MKRTTTLLTVPLRIMDKATRLGSRLEPVQELYKAEPPEPDRDAGGKDYRRTV